MYGSLIMALSHPFFDERIRITASETLFKRLELLGEQAFKMYDQKDYGPRGRALEPKIHTYCAAMCWAACDRLSRISCQLSFADRAHYWRSIANKIATFIKTNCWNEDIKSYVTVVDGHEVDGFILRLEEIGFLEPTDSRFLSTLERIEKKLKRKNFLAMEEHNVYASNSVTFWYISALERMGRKEEARKLFLEILSTFDSGMISETLHPETREPW